MIRSFRGAAAEDLFQGRSTRAVRQALRQALWRIAVRKLEALDSAEELHDLRVPPGNRLEQLKGDRVGQYSIRINNQYGSASDGARRGRKMSRSSTTTEGPMVRVPTHRTPIHPGEMLLEEFLKPMDLTQRDLADAIGVPYQRINEIVNGRRGITPSTAVRLAHFFDMSSGFWLNLQTRWDLYHAERTEAAVLKKIPRYRSGKRSHSRN